MRNEPTGDVVEVNEQAVTNLLTMTAAASATPAAPAPAPAPVATTSTANPVAGEQPIAGLINCEFALSFKICRACC